MKVDFSSNQPEIEQRAFEISRRAGDIIQAKLHDLLASDNAQGNTARLKDFMNSFLPEASLDLAQQLETLESEKDKERFVEKAGAIIVRLIAEHLSLIELEQRLRSRQNKENGYQELSRGLTFDIHHNTIFLHVPVTFFNNSAEAIQSLIEGLKVLANKIKTDEALKDITGIMGHSNLVKEKHRLIERLGFEIALDKDGKPSDQAQISKKKLLEMYAKTGTDHENT